MITAENISYQEIIKDISFEIPDHGVVGLVGPNGSGKTTLLRTLFGALQPTAGRVLLNGKPLSTMRARTIAHELSVVAQDSGEPPQMTVAEVVRLGRLPHKDNSADGIIAALKNVGMLHKAKAPLTHLSGGERQRVMIARAFIQDASHILLDEPTNHLDIHYQMEVFNQIKHYRANATVVLHDLNMALEYCDWIHLLDDGRLVESGPPGDVLVPEILEPIYHVGVVRTEHHLHFERLEK
ncbi:ABC transporter ATP-binding protein [Corynebacterium propinquum]|uniref:ABC transporter ATP-binding protein n=1 Tax=Corynebacterium propinquum TaxID=43769 RepID=UPI003CA6A837